jgi:hypothetical protein
MFHIGIPSGFAVFTGINVDVSDAIVENIEVSIVERADNIDEDVAFVKSE